MYKSRLNIYIIILATIFLSCNNINSSDSVNEVEEEKIIFQGKEYFKIVDQSQGNLERFKSKDNYFLVISKAFKQNAKQKSANKNIGDDVIENTFKYNYNSTTRYASSIFDNIGYFSQYDNDYTNERFRVKIKFENLSGAIPSNAIINSTGIRIYKVAPFGNEGVGSERNGIIEFRKFPTTNPPTKGTKAFYDFIGTSTSYFDVQTSTSRTHEEKVTTSGQFFDDVKNVFDNNKDEFALAIKSQNEFSSGALIQLQWADLVVLYTLPPAISSTPSLQSPADDSFQESSVFFSWNPSTGTAPITYQIQVDDNSNFSSPLVNQSGITSTSKTVNSLSRNKTYYWRVKSSNQVGSSGWSQTRTIKIRPASPNVTSSIQGLAPKLTWNSVSGATQYSIFRDARGYTQVSPSLFSTTTTSTSYLDLSLTFPAVTSSTGFYYRVSAVNSQGWYSLQSSAKYFEEDGGGGGRGF